MSLNPRLTNKLGLAIVLGSLLPVAVAAQNITSLNTTAKGTGSIVSRVDKHEITSVMVILEENGDASFTFYADLQLSATGSWSQSKSSNTTINIKITGGVVSGSANGIGKLLLRKDAKTIDRLTLEATAADGSKTTVNFVADKPSEKPSGV